MTRKRTRESMLHTLTEPCPHCDGKGYTKSRKTVAYEVLRDLRRQGDMVEGDSVMVEVHPHVADTLGARDRVHVDEIEKRLQKRVVIRSNRGMHVEEFDIRNPNERRSKKDGVKDERESRMSRRKKQLAAAAMQGEAGEDASQIALMTDLPSADASESGFLAEVGDADAMAEMKSQRHEGGGLEGRSTGSAGGRGNRRRGGKGRGRRRSGARDQATGSGDGKGGRDSRRSEPGEGQGRRSRSRSGGPDNPGREPASPAGDAGGGSRPRETASSGDA